MPDGVEIKTYVVLHANGRVIGVRLNKLSAVDLMQDYPKSKVEPHTAHKRIRQGSRDRSTNGTYPATQRKDQE